MLGNPSSKFNPPNDSDKQNKVLREKCEALKEELENKQKEIQRLNKQLRDCKIAVGDLHKQNQSLEEENKLDAERIENLENALRNNNTDQGYVQSLQTEIGRLKKSLQMAPPTLTTQINMEIKDIVGGLQEKFEQLKACKNKLERSKLIEDIEEKKDDIFNISFQIHKICIEFSVFEPQKLLFSDIYNKSPVQLKKCLEFLNFLIDNNLLTMKTMEDFGNLNNLLTMKKDSEEDYGKLNNEFPPFEYHQACSIKVVCPAAKYPENAVKLAALLNKENDLKVITSIEIKRGQEDAFFGLIREATFEMARSPSQILPIEKIFFSSKSFLGQQTTTLVCNTISPYTNFSLLTWLLDEKGMKQFTVEGEPELKKVPPKKEFNSIRAMFRKIVENLRLLHEKNVICRNLNHRSILVNSKDCVFFTNVGFPMKYRSTTLGFFLQAPEVRENSEPGPKADIFSIGMILYLIFVDFAKTKFVPNPQTNVSFDMLNLEYFKSFPDFGKFTESSVQNLCDVINACISQEPSKRPTAEELLRLEFFNPPGKPNKPQEKPNPSEKKSYLPPFSESKMPQEKPNPPQKKFNPPPFSESKMPQEKPNPPQKKTHQFPEFKQSPHFENENSNVDVFQNKNSNFNHNPKNFQNLKTNADPMPSSNSFQNQNSILNQNTNPNYLSNFIQAVKQSISSALIIKFMGKNITNEMLKMIIESSGCVYDQVDVRPANNFPDKFNFASVKFKGAGEAQKFMSILLLNKANIDGMQNVVIKITQGVGKQKKKTHNNSSGQVSGNASGRISAASNYTDSDEEA